MSYEINAKVAGLDEVLAKVAAEWGTFSATMIASAAYIPPEIKAKVEISMNLYFLTEAIQNARIDLGRWVDFHLPDDDGRLPDNHKYAAFVSRWIAKLRPVQVIDRGLEGDFPEYLYKLNAAFAVHVFRSYLTAPIPDSMAKELIYRFQFRDPSGTDLALIAFTCEQISKK